MHERVGIIVIIDVPDILSASWPHVNTSEYPHMHAETDVRTRGHTSRKSDEETETLQQ